MQRVRRASVTVQGECVGAIEQPGLLVLTGVTHDDGPEQVRRMARKVAELRILRAPAAAGISAEDLGAQDISVHDLGAQDVSAIDVGAPVLVVSQFTLYADTRKGRRPSWSAAAPAALAEPLVQAFVDALRSRGLEVATGVFGADMAVELVNDGPVTILLET